MNTLRGEAESGTSGRPLEQSAVRNVSRALSLIEYLAAQSGPVTLAEATAALGMPKSSTLLIIRTLVQDGYCQRSSNGSYTLIRLPGQPGAHRSSWAQLARLAAPAIATAVEALGETGFLAVRVGLDEIRYVNKLLPSNQEIIYDRNISLPRRIAETSSGIAILAALEDEEVASALGGVISGEAAARIAECRQSGVAINLAGRHDGASGVAAVLLDPTGQPLGAVNLAGPAARFEERISLATLAVAAAAQSINSTILASSPRSGELHG